MHMDMKDDANEVANNLENAYHSINQTEDMRVRKTIMGLLIPSDLDVIHIGAHSIHIFIRQDDTTFRIQGGICELNQQFDLLEPPHQRQIATCIKWLSCRLPPSLQTFAVIGDGVQALCPPQVELEQHMFCLREDFIRFAQHIAFQEARILQTNPIGDSNCLQKDVALHCVILAGLFKSGASKFMPYF
ncbi:hypothetical protein A8709_17130 [Paenibacillus pectinilyticus]|uniref:Uncharacterized protein n=1 Tax=Paenibacillus pectinilyticus TaxID=512399 RepID=A0A1C1A226_9BACL|nr:hypothetical protein [Paenibacillus pectinilyticus]OCT14590.1 hypothetical protein A8709_17130 [Paenibacillus pectinilyticus]